MDEYMLNDLLECSVCLERLDTSSRVLPCQHTFCKKCLEEIVATKKELRCPECRVLVTIKIDDLPPNVLLMRILGGMRSSSNAQPKQQKSNILAPQPIGSAPVAHIQPRAAALVAPEITRVHHAPSPLKQTLLPNTPYARAVYDYLSNEPGDLRFKKGDVIVLRKKMDANWYHGESGGNHGVFPLTYVQVMTPLPSHIPQCKALYDFRMTNDDEEGCLTFNKGEVITVIRRVDENWAEGKLTDRIGIFPLAFVELNNVARALMKLSTNSQPGPSRVAPPTPTSEDTTPLIPTDHSRTVSAAPPRHHITMGAASDSSSAVSSASSSTTTPATSSSNTSSSSSTAPSSPASPPPPRPTAAGVGSPPPRPAHSASMSPPTHAAAQSRGKRHSFTVTNSAGHVALASHRHSAEILASSVSENTSSEALDLSMGSQHPEPMPRQGSQRHRRSGSQDGAPPPQGVHSSAPLPAHYVALYAYKPQKADEMELRKGSVYVVTERCQDGWFKGTSSRTQKGGVFPGNYVVPAKVVSGGMQAQLRGSRPTSSPQLSPRANGADATPPAAAVSYTRSGGSPFAAASRQPPELPPRAASPQWADPTRTPDKKERKEKGSSSGVSLMRRLQTSIKKSKSPPPSYSMDNPVFDDGSVTASPVHPVHVRASAESAAIGAAAATPGGAVANHHRKSNSLDAGSGDPGRKPAKVGSTPVRERFRCIVPYPPNSEYELELRVGDVIYVHKKRDDGWYKGTQQRTGKTGLFPASFVETF